MLRVEDLHVSYGRFEVLRGVFINIETNEIVSVIGGNGAGKSTLVKAISGFVPFKQGKIFYKELDVAGYPPEKLVRLGMVQVLERRRLFNNFTVMDNLQLGSYLYHRNKEQVQTDLGYVFNIFPILKERKSQIAGSLSGGEQQMLAFGRALMAQPKFLILDEPSLGLAPMITQEIFRVIRHLHQKGITILLIEQNAYAALEISKRGYVLKDGRIYIEGTSNELISNKTVSQAYLGR